MDLSIQIDSCVLLDQTSIPMRFLITEVDEPSPPRAIMNRSDSLWLAIRLKKEVIRKESHKVLGNTLLNDRAEANTLQSSTLEKCYALAPVFPVQFAESSVFFRSYSLATETSRPG